MTSYTPILSPKPKLKIRSFLSVLFFFSILFSTQNSHAQLLELAGSAKDKVREKKKQKSPANSELTQLDELVEFFKTDTYRSYSAERLFENGNGMFYKKRMRNYKTADSLITVIKTKDPKWKFDEEETTVQKFKPKYDELTVMVQKQEENLKKFEEYNNFLLRKGKGFKETHKNPKSFFEYVSSKDTSGFEWEKTQQMMPDIKAIEKEYTKKYPNSHGMSGLSIYERNRSSFGIHYYMEKDYKEISQHDVYSVSDITKTNIPKASKTLTTDIYLLKSWSTLYPEDERFSSLLKKAEERKKTLSDYFKNSLAVSDFHAEVISGVFFSNHPIEFGKETAADFKTEFEAGESIYVIEYRAYKSTDEPRIFEVSGNGFRSEAYYEVLNPKGETTARQYLLIPNLDDASKLRHESGEPLFRDLKDLSSGKIELEVAKQNISINLDAGTANFDKIYAQYKKQRMAKMPLPKAGMVDASVNSLVRKACKEEGFKGQILKITILSKEWDYEKNKYSGRITGRSMEDICVYYKDAEGNCFFRIISIGQSKTDTEYSLPWVSGTAKNYYTGDGPFTRYIADDEYEMFYINCGRI